MSRRLSAVVTVELRVQVHVGSWGADTNFITLEKQALREASNSLAHLCKNSNIRPLGDPGIMSVQIKESP